MTDAASDTALTSDVTEQSFQVTFSSIPQTYRDLELQIFAHRANEPYRRPRRHQDPKISKERGLGRDAGHTFGRLVLCDISVNGVTIHRVDDEFTIRISKRDDEIRTRVAKTA